MRAIYLAPALLLSVLAFAPAQAAPLAPVGELSNGSLAAEQPIVLAQFQPGPHRAAPHRAAPHRAAPRYRAGHRYGSAPNGWHRYDRRPGDWNRRGCILVGPVWFCP